MNQHAEAATGIANWRQAIEENPDVTWRIMQDIIKVIQAEAAPKRTGRRPSPDAMGMDELLETIYPERFAMDPFPDALARLMGDTTQMEFSRAMHVSQPQLSRLLSGKVKPDMAVMAAAAHAGGVTPAYFVEWRAGHLAELLTEIYVLRPNLSVVAVKTLAKAVKP